MKKQGLIIIIFLTCILSGFAQTGSITGTVIDEMSGEVLIGATCVITGTTKGTISDFDGNFSLNNLQSDSYNITISYVSYQSKEIKGLIVKANETIRVDVKLEESTLALSEVKVVAKANRESENLLLMEQRDANVAIESIGAQELSRKGISDASAAATKITGITKQEGQNSLNVRGLGDRYNTTTLNGLPLPSNDSRLKNIDLGLFTSDIISHISVEKSYSPWLYGDFGGANVNINTKKFTGEPFLSMTVSPSYNTSLFDYDEFNYFEGPSKLGFQNEDFSNASLLKNNAEYPFKNSWDNTTGGMSPNIELGISTGKSFELNSDSKLNTFFTASFENERYISEIVKRTINASNARYIDIEGPTHVYNTQTTALLNLNYSASGHDIYLTSMFLNSGNQRTEEYKGYISEEGGDESYRRMLEFEENLILVNQLLGDHKLGEKSEINWGISYNLLTNKIPDRRQNTFMEYYGDTEMGVFSAEPTGTNYRYFHEYTDNELAGNINLKLGLGEEVSTDRYKGSMILGYSGKLKNRNFESHQFLHDIYRDRDPGAEVFAHKDSIDAFLNNTNFVANEFFVSDVVAGGFTYTGKVMTNAFFAAFEYNLSQKLLFLIGGRFENVYQFVDYSSNQGTGDESIDEYKFLPSLSVKFAPNQQNNIRLSGSKTYTLPQLREMPGIIFQDDVTEQFRGNPKIYPSTVYNAEIKYEFFPVRSELYSIAAFYKYIQDPMNKFVTGSSSVQYSVANTGDWASVYGVEAEVKKELIKRNKLDKTNKLSGEANITLMESKQDLNANKVLDDTGKLLPIFNGTQDQLQGSAQVIGNLSLSHVFLWKENKNSITSTLVYNYVSERIYSLGYLSVGNRVDQPVNTLDFIVRSKFNKLSVNISFKNILNSKIYRIQMNQTQDWEILSYYKGTKLGISLSYTF